MRKAMSREDEFNRKVFEENKDRIYRVCCYYVRNAEDRKDLFQEVFTHIFKGLDKFEGKSSLSTWIYRITVNSCLAYLNKEKRRKRLHSDLSAHHKNQANDGTQFEKLLDKKKDIQFLYETIDQLSFVDKSIISLMLENVSHKEIADVLGISEENVRVKIHRIKKNLSHMMNREKK
jgi:RNA polymerase sigma-70 factor (ECF subfamily)